jgi:hypothetical protein
LIAASQALRVAAGLVALALAACGPPTDTSHDGGTDGGTDGGPAPALRLNELLPSNSATCTDEQGEFDDYVEFYNPGAAAVNLAGWSITDDLAVPLKNRFDDTLAVPAGGVLALWADDTPSQGANHLPFKLRAKGELVVLFDPAGKEVDRWEWTNAIDGVSLERLPDGTGAFTACAKPTCGAKNGTSCNP